MKKANTMELSFERIINGSPNEVYEGWLNPKVPGTPWHEHDDLILNVKKNGLYYWLTNNTAHYGRFLELKRGQKIQLTWMSQYTLGVESTVTITFKKHAEGTMMKLVHSNLPKEEKAKAHNEGWTYFMDKIVEQYAKKAARKKKK